MKRPLGDRAIAEETRDHSPALLHFHCECHAGGKRDSAPHNGDARHHPFLHIAHVHRSPFASAAAGGRAKELEEQLLGRESFRQRVAMPSKGGGDEVTRLEGRAHAHGRRLLALALVDRSGHGPLQEQELHPLLKLANHDHPPVKVEEEVACVIGSRLRPRRCRAGSAVALKE